MAASRLPAPRDDRFQAAGISDSRTATGRRSRTWVLEPGRGLEGSLFVASVMRQDPPWLTAADVNRKFSLPIQYHPKRDTNVVANSDRGFRNRKWSSDACELQCRPNSSRDMVCAPSFPKPVCTRHLDAVLLQDSHSFRDAAKLGECVTVGTVRHDLRRRFPSSGVAAPGKGQRWKAAISANSPA